MYFDVYMSQVDSNISVLRSKWDSMNLLQRADEQCQRAHAVKIAHLRDDYAKLVDAADSTNTKVGVVEGHVSQVCSGKQRKTFFEKGVV